ncbi:MAG: hypothetical protein LBQ01_06440 [Prevotellaceae bacterium]|jgi:hypothetical protein|nr:hypothetical protein [Prevotellaceae bacterium]
MKNRKIIAIICIIIGFVVFIGIALYTKLFSSTELPVQISGALLEAAVTAVLTYVLLSGQTSQEELKERNVKVFEAKSVKFNDFINQLWKVWEDRSIDLDELNELTKSVSQNIVPYTRPQTVEIILSRLIEIAKRANPYQTDSSDKEVTELIQRNIFDIINELSKEIGLGGAINEAIRQRLNELDGYCNNWKANQNK